MALCVNYGLIKINRYMNPAYTNTMHNYRAKHNHIDRGLNVTVLLGVPTRFYLWPVYNYSNKNLCKTM